MYSMVKKDFNRVQNFVRANKRVLVAACVGGVALIGANSASATATIPDIGVDVVEYMAAGIAAMGLIVASALGGYVAFLLIRKAFRWLGKSIG